MAVAPTITYLLNKVDTIEFVREQIAAILKLEAENQVTLAIADGQTPEQARETYALDVYVERWTNWDNWINKEDNSFTEPVVNVWWSSDSVMPNASNMMERQAYKATFYIDIYGHGRARDVDGGGHIDADRDAVNERDRGKRWVRNFLAAAGNVYLQAQGTVWESMVVNTELFVPTVDNDQPVPRVKAARVTLEVTFNEFSPQIDGETLELASIDICTVDPATGQVSLAAEVDIQYPLPT